MPTLPTVRISLRDYWAETIPRADGLERLARAPGLDDDARAKFEPQIPDRTVHYLKFDAISVREYADLGDGIAHVVFQLPITSEDGRYVLQPVPAPTHNFPSSRLEDLSVHEFRVVDGRLFENGRLRSTFSFYPGPTELDLDISPLMPGPLPDEVDRSRGCCLACYVVHSALDVHELDPICCLGTCGNWPRV